MISILTICEIVCREIRPTIISLGSVIRWLFNYPDNIISSSTPYSFICCKPQPSLTLLGIYLFRSPVKLGVWYIRTSTLSGPNSATNGASREADDGFGDSLVPRRASVRILSLRFGFDLRAFSKVAICRKSMVDTRGRLDDIY